MRKEWIDTDYYAILGVSKDASQQEIKKAFRKLARDSHPDANNANSDTQFKQINKAYEVLSDKDTRKEYDHTREMGYFVGGPGGSQQYVRMEDLLTGDGSPFDVFGGERLSEIFGRPTRRSQPGRDLSANLSLTFHEAISGVTKQVTIHGNTTKVKIPQGVENGSRIRLKGQGESGSRGGPSGDAYVTVRVAEHPVFSRSGSNLGITVPITFIEATLGAKIDVPTLEGSIRLRIPSGTKTGKIFRVNGRGVQTTKDIGDLLVTVEIIVPTELTNEQRASLKNLKDNGLNENPRTHLGV